MGLRTSCVITVLLLSVSSELFMSSEALALRSSMTGVKFNEVELRLVTLPPYKSRLYERAFQSLSSAGLIPQRKIDRHLVEEGKASILIITLVPDPIDGWPDHYSYVHSIELQEWVYFDRVKGRVPLTSWSFKPIDLTPHVIVGAPTVERLEQDLDRMLKELIQHYKAVNSPAK